MKIILLTTAAVFAFGSLAQAGASFQEVVGLGNYTASQSPGKGNNENLASVWNNHSDHLKTNAENKSGKGRSSDVGEGRERADEFGGPDVDIGL